MPYKSSAIAHASPKSASASATFEEHSLDDLLQLRTEQQKSGKGRTNTAVALLANSFQEQVITIWSGPRMAEYLSATDARRQVWHAWLAASRDSFSECNAMSADLAYRQLSSASGKHLLIQAYGICPPGAMNVLGKLGPMSRSPEIYRNLIKVLNDTEFAGAKLLRHANEITDDVVLGLATLPSGFGSRPIVDLFKAGRIPGDAMGYFCWTIKRVEQLRGPKAVKEIMASTRPLVDLRNVILDMAFPVAPWDGTRLIEPLSSEPMLRKAAEDFGNCLIGAHMRSDAVLKVLSGRRYFYRWRGEEPALLAFKPVGRIGWYLEEISGTKNEPVSPRTLSLISDALRESRCMCSVAASDWVLSDGRPYRDF